RHPEHSVRETESARFIAEALREAGIPCRPIAGTGVRAKIEGRGDLRRAVVLRADIDALPIRDQSGAAWSSENDGVMHACGHDIHAAVLYGTLLRLSAERNF
ncbi:M20/M25/M40 family metallo-hydrolase, partial [Alistipes putredinis]|uniref:M20/M25/M40 family metallo-hydrolase n=1 Tax=Alistipes putredinis TaxID=28117 RepID=UPI0023AEB206